MSVGLHQAANELTILTVPGLYGSNRSHWQTRWERLYGFSRIKQKDWENPDFYQWSESLYQTIEKKRNNAGIILVAHSMGCHLIVKCLPLINDRIKGVFLVAPPDLETRMINKDVSSFFVDFQDKLDVPGYLVFSENDPYASVEYSQKFGNALGIEKINVGRLGHINSDSQIGDWDNGAVLLNKLQESVYTCESILA